MVKWMTSKIREFPRDFMWGVSTSAYQIEGAWNVDGKGESVWDRFVRRDSSILDRSTGDTACNHYNMLRDDVDLIADLGGDVYRYSITWPRVFPDGDGRAEPRGFAFYDRLIDSLLEHGITPFVTLFHWDLPQTLEDRGGWTSRSTAWRFAEYTAAMARHFGDRVHNWITLNEPLSVTGAGYLAGTHAPGRRSPVA